MLNLKWPLGMGSLGARAILSGPYQLVRRYVEVYYDKISNNYYTVVFWGSKIWLKIFAQIQCFLALKRAKNLELWETRSGIFSVISFGKIMEEKQILMCFFLQFERKSSCHWSILAIFWAAIFLGKLLCKNLWYIWLFYKLNKYSLNSKQLILALLLACRLHNPKVPSSNPVMNKKKIFHVFYCISTSKIHFL